MANSMKSETMLMSGVQVDFPYKPYPCQIAMLTRIIKALQQSKHCLLESPTGTGKTITLLCAALAWQQKEIEQTRISLLNENKDNSTETTPKQPPISRIFYCTRTHKQLEQVAKQMSNTTYKDRIRMTLLSSRDNYCIHPVVSKGSNKNYECSKLTRRRQQQFSQPGLKSDCGFYERLKGKMSNDFTRLTGPKQLPHVFDIEQFTDYCRIQHAICPYYTSRLLINDVQIILCPYNYLIDPRVRNSLQMTINNSVIIIDEAHNIEECARESMKFEMRKYDFDIALDEFRSYLKALETAQIKTTQLITNESGFSCTQMPISSTPLNSSQQQSSYRTAGYSEFDQINDEIDLLEHLNIDQHGNNQNQNDDDEQQSTIALNSNDDEIANALKFLADRFSRICLWFEMKDPKEKYTFSPKDLIEQFHRAKFIDKSMINVHRSATKISPAMKRSVVQDAGRIRKALSKCVLNGPDYIRFSDETGRFLEDVDLCLSVLYADDFQFADDYKIVLKTIPFEPSANALAQMQTIPSDNSISQSDGEWINRSQKSTQFKPYQRYITQTAYPLHTQQLVFYCLSPSVAFAKDLKLARSLIFASGTLAPLATYSGELKIPFDFQLECNHVIDFHRTFITALSHGRNSNVKLRATYQNTDKFEFQDECGLLLLDICQRVPYGVLCFVPSYRFLNVIINRWMSSGLWQKLGEYKSVFFEEKNRINFQTTINQFRQANGTLKIVKPLSDVTKRVRAMFKRKQILKTTENENTTTNSPYFPAKGGLLLAVCRGRASEGIDFSDNNARCVVTLGIPYPNVQDEEVIFKRNYNNEQNKRLPQIMNGSDWYDSQAYRALNQALGRCIRHKNDWGALLIVDERIAQSINEKQMTNKISLWIKQRLFISQNYQQTMDDLERFTNEMTKLEEINPIEKQQESKTKIIDDDDDDDEERRLSSIVPPLIEIPKKIKEEETTTTNYRQWKINDLTDDDDEEKSTTNQCEQKKSIAFEKFIAQRPISMQPLIQEKKQLTDDENTNEQMKITKSQISNLNLKPSKIEPILSQKNLLVRPRTIIDLTDDDDFFPTQAEKKLRLT